MKRLPTDFFEKCPVQEIPIGKSLIQIHADETEIRRRVNCFVERKREDIGLNNIKDFIETKSNDELSSCARVNSSIYRLKNSNKLFEGKNKMQNNVNYTFNVFQCMSKSS